MSPPTFRGKTTPNQDLFAPEPFPQLFPHPARRPARSSPRGKHRPPWPGHRCRRAGRGSAAGSSSRKNPPGRLREKQDKHPSQDRALEACATLPEPWVDGLIQSNTDFDQEEPVTPPQGCSAATKRLFGISPAQVRGSSIPPTPRNASLPELAGEAGWAGKGYLAGRWVPSTPLSRGSGR